MYKGKKNSPSCNLSGHDFQIIGLVSNSDNSAMVVLRTRERKVQIANP
jgi:glutaredoxin-related protein